MSPTFAKIVLEFSVNQLESNGEVVANLQRNRGPGQKFSIDATPPLIALTTLLVTFTPKTKSKIEESANVHIKIE